MKLYKIDFNNQIGKNIVTVPTDSEFLLGLSNGDSAATIKLYDGATEITALEDKVGNYTCFRFSTNETPSRKVYKGADLHSSPGSTVYLPCGCEEFCFHFLFFCFSIL